MSKRSLLEAALLSLAGGFGRHPGRHPGHPAGCFTNAGLALLDLASIPVAPFVALATGIIF